MADVDFFTNDPNDQARVFHQMQDDQMAEENKRRQINDLKLRLEELQKQLKTLKNQKKEDEALKEAQLDAEEQLRKEIFGSQKTLKKLRGKVEKMRKSMDQLREEMYRAQEARAKIPQALVLVRNFTPQELNESLRIRTLEEIAHGVTSLTSYRNQAGVLSEMLREKIESVYTDFDKKIIDLLEIGQNPALSVGADYKNLLEMGIYEVGFWDNLSDIATNEVEKRSDLLSQFESRLKEYLSTIDEVFKLVGVQEGKADSAASDIKLLARRIERLTDEIGNLEAEIEKILGELRGLGVVEAQPTSGEREPERQTTVFSSSADVARVTLVPRGSKEAEDSVSGGKSQKLSDIEDGSSRPERVESGDRARVWIGSIRERLTAEGYEYVSFASGIFRRIRANLTGEMPANLESVDFRGGFSEGYLARAVIPLPMKTVTWGLRKGGAIKKAVLGKVAGAIGMAVAPPGLNWLVGWAAGKIGQAVSELYSKYGRQIALGVAGGISAFMIMLANLGSAVMAGALGGMVTGAIFGSVFGPAGTILGAIGGGLAGGGLGYLLQTAGVNLMPLAVGFVNFLGAVGGALSSAIIGMGTIVSGVVVAGAGVLTFMFVGSIGVFNTSFALGAGEIAEYEPPPLFTVHKEIVGPKSVSSLPTGETVSYSVTITPNKEVTDQDLVIKSVKDELSASGVKVTFSKNPASLPKDSSFTYTITNNGPELTDVHLYNTITVTAYPADDETKVETHVDRASLKIGSPKDDVPYGFPSTGSVLTLDVKYITVNGQSWWHCSIMLVPDAKTCLRGGIDIGAAANSPVVSTLNGKVVHRKYDLTNSGGVIFIDSESGEYRTAYIHLNDDMPAVGTIVTRGQKIGTIYPHSLPKSSGPHIHYQVARNDGGFRNLLFASPGNAGTCGEPGKIMSPTDNTDAIKGYVQQWSQLKDPCL